MNEKCDTGKIAGVENVRMEHAGYMNMNVVHWGEPP